MQPSLPNPSVTPQPPAPSPTPVVPGPAVVPQPEYNTGFNGANLQPTATKRKKWPIILAIVGGLIVLALLFMFIGLYSPAGRTKVVSENFMSAITNSDIAKAAKYSQDGNSADTQTFLTTSAAKTHGTYALRETKFVDNKRYTLYDLTGADSKYARVTVEKSDKTWLVSSYVYSTTALSLMPATSDTTTSTSTTPSAATPVASSNGCLVKSDYDILAQELTGTPTNEFEWSATSPYNDNVHFNADQLTFDDDRQANDVIAGYASFYKAHPDKDYKISLKGSVATTANSDLDFAKQRAQKVADVLKADGVVADKIVIDTPEKIDTYGGDSTGSVNQQIARSVVLTVMPGCAASTSTGSSR